MHYQLCVSSGTDSEKQVTSLRPTLTHTVIRLAYLWKTSRNSQAERNCGNGQKPLTSVFSVVLVPRLTVSYAQKSYGIDISEAEAARFRTMLTEHVYPELTIYLRSNKDRETVVTPTERIRPTLTTPKLETRRSRELPADGCKLAMWKLLKAGYRMVGFVHDEFVIEPSRLADCTSAVVHIKSNCIESMQRLTGDIPITTENALTERW